MAKGKEVNEETAKEIIKRVDPTYNGANFRTRLDYLADSADIPIHQLRPKLLQAGAEFDNPHDIAPDSWFTLELKKPKNEVKIHKSSGVTLKPKKGGKISAFPSQDSNADIFGDHDRDVD